MDRDGLEAWEEGVWGSEDSNLRRCCKAFLSERFQACCCSRYQVLLRRVLGPLGLQGRPRAGGKGEGEKGKEREQERRDTQSLLIVQLWRPHIVLLVHRFSQEGATLREETVVVGCEAVLWPLASLLCPLTLKNLESYHLDSNFKSAKVSWA